MPEVESAIAGISAGSLRGHVSFLASDLLEGRNTPSPGLEIAAEYVASQFRRAGLEPGARDYFQIADMVLVKPSFAGFEFAVEMGGATIRVQADKVSIQAPGAVDLKRAPAIKIDLEHPAALEQWTPEQVRGKVLVGLLPDFNSMDSGRRRQFFTTRIRLNSAVARLKPALIVTLRRGGEESRGAGPRLRDLSDPPAAPALLVSDPALVEAFESVEAGAVDAVFSVHLAPPAEERVKLKNVVAVVRGSDPGLKGTYVLVTAHYDHMGRAPDGEGDRVYNGANDNASGTAAVIELAGALARLREKPKRTVIFTAVFGEEKGLLGSRYYARHPLFPIEKTVANINLEQLGRTDDVEGPQIARASLTGFDYSDIGETFRKAGELTGITVFKSGNNSDSYFGRSDNQVFAALGIPAHTLSVGYVFPDYHRPGDHWDKLDYANMEKITRMTALGVLMIANNPEPPRWNESNPKAERYWKIRKQHTPR